jgi:uncharacterized glyoxalase superfamily protein PhnB
MRYHGRMKELIVTRQTIYPAVRYLDAHVAIEWLERAFGAERHVVYDTPDGKVAHAQVRIAGNLIMLGDNQSSDYPVRSPQEAGAATGGFYIVLPDAAAVDAMHARAVAAGARIHREPNDTDYGSHEFGALDLEGHPWSFGTYDPETA